MEDTIGGTTAEEIGNNQVNKVADQLADVKEGPGPLETAATGKWAGKPPNDLKGRLREPEPSSEEDNECKACHRGKSVRRPLRCQVDGCGVDLAQARKYFQRYRVCERHLKAPQLQMDGRSVRFCDQCSKFHDISMFEGTRRTCNEKLERTRQARSDKRRYDSEQVAALRAIAGWRARSGDCGFAQGLKRQHGEGYGFSDVTHEDYAMLDNGVGSGGFPRVKRGRALPQASPLPLPPASVATSLGTLQDQLEAQGILALHRAALTAVQAVASGGGGTVGTGAGVDLHVTGFARTHHASSGTSGGGGASSHFSHEDGQPNSICSPAGSECRSQGPGYGTHMLVRGDVAGVGGAAGVAGSELALGFQQGQGRDQRPGQGQMQGSTGRDGGPVQRPTSLGPRAAGPAPGPPGAVQAAAALHDLYRPAGGGALAAGSQGADLGAVLDGRSDIDAMLDALRGGGTGGEDGYGGGSGSSGVAASRLPGLAPIESPPPEALTAQGRCGRGAQMYGGGGVSARELAASASAGKPFFAQPLAVEMAADGMVDVAALAPYRGVSGPRDVADVGGGAAASSRQPQLAPEDLCVSEDAGGGSVDGGNDADEATLAALWELVAALAARRITARTQYDAGNVRRPADRRIREEALAMAELLLSELRSGGGGDARGPLPGAFPLDAAGTSCRAGFRTPAESPRGAATASRTMLPVLDLTQTQGPVARPLPALPATLGAGGDRASGGAATGADGNAVLLRLLHRLHFEPQQQQPQPHGRYPERPDLGRPGAEEALLLLAAAEHRQQARLAHRTAPRHLQQQQQHNHLHHHYYHQLQSVSLLSMLQRQAADEACLLQQGQDLQQQQQQQVLLQLRQHLLGIGACGDGGTSIDSTATPLHQYGPPYPHITMHGDGCAAVSRGLQTWTMAAAATVRPQQQGPP